MIAQNIEKAVSTLVGLLDSKDEHTPGELSPADPSMTALNMLKNLVEVSR